MAGLSSILELLLESRALGLGLGLKANTRLIQFLLIPVVDIVAKRLLLMVMVLMKILSSYWSKMENRSDVQSIMLLQPKLIFTHHQLIQMELLFLQSVITLSIQHTVILIILSILLPMVTLAMTAPI